MPSKTQPQRATSVGLFNVRWPAYEVHYELNLNITDGRKSGYAAKPDALYHSVLGAAIDCWAFRVKDIQPPYTMSAKLALPGQNVFHSERIGKDKEAAFRALAEKCRKSITPTARHTKTKRTNGAVSGSFYQQLKKRPANNGL